MTAAIEAAPKPLLDATQRRVVWAVTISIVAILSISASLNLVVTPMVAELSGQDSSTVLMRQLPSVAALLVVFAASALGQRLGDRRVMLFSTLLFVAGSLAVALAPTELVASLGLVAASIARSLLTVLGLAYMSSAISSPDGRAAAFGTYATAQPISALTLPLLAGVLLAAGSWRWVAGAWAVCGALGMLALWFWIPRGRARHRQDGEMVTPALAGVILAVGVQLVTRLTVAGLTPETIAYAVILALATLCLVVLMRRLSQPTMSLAPLRHAGLPTLLAATAVFAIPGLWFYMTIALQYFYGLTALQVALAFIPVEVAGVLAAKLTGYMIRSRGLMPAGVVAGVADAAALAGCAMLPVGTPAWVGLILMVLCSAATVSFGVVLTKSVMDRATPDEAGSTSSFRIAAAATGSALGVALMASVFAFGTSTTVISIGPIVGVDRATAARLAHDVVDGATPEELATKYSAPPDYVPRISALKKQAYLAGFHTQAVAGALGALCAVGLFVWARRQIPAGDHPAESGSRAAAG